MIKKLLFIAAVCAIALYLWQPWSQGEVADATAPASQAGPQPPVHKPQKEANSKDKQPAPDNKQQARSLPDEFYQQREEIISALDQAKACQDTGECASSEDDPRAAMFEQEKRLVAALKALQELYASHQFEDEQLAAITGEYLTSPLGRVQYQALEMMQQQSPVTDNARILLEALDDSYDDKVMESALTELQRYPELNQTIDGLFIKNLRTGSFHVSRTIAQGIGPYLNQDNLDAYEAVLDKLPGQSAKARFLSASISSYKKSNNID
ncbi:hypothetical protein [Lacimicrobium alkaliphilum]|uniref:Uncharacterized protein n=1 Tax=Lacimicrobium alkaliphilum TaxID=1526571 RepID=A0A0U2RI63_9ALTE|nr:hypothetical protein [Lacimicrobium alkaliphilum]ALS96874.1 hypothetical protein AT746_00340 [Lacimicrobium alkaliphilum]